MKTVVQRLMALRRDESGQSLVFGVMTVFMVMFFAAMVVGVGRVTARRIQMQFAADSAAYSSALVESDCLNSIALLNTSMAQLRHMAMRYVADVNVYGVLAELRDQVLGQEVTEYDGLQQAIADLQQQLAQTQDPAEQAEMQNRINYLMRRRDALFPGGPPRPGRRSVPDSPLKGPPPRHMASPKTGTLSGLLTSGVFQDHANGRPWSLFPSVGRLSEIQQFAP